MKSVEEIIERALSQRRKWLLEPEAKEVCRQFQIPVPEFGVAVSKEEAVNLANKIGYPVVLKIISPQVIHKSDVGGVIIGLKSDAEIREAYDKIIERVRKKVPNAIIEGVLVEKMYPSDVEVIVGMTKDPQFGPAIMFGLGGIFVEILKDVSFRIVPINEEDAREMIQEIKAYPILAGVRGKEQRDIDAIVKIILKVSELVSRYKQINQLDLNPIFVYEKGKGAVAVDARIILEEGSIRE